MSSIPVAQQVTSSKRDPSGAAESLGEGVHQKVAVITGASGGIGAGLVARYRSLEYLVAATARSIADSDDPGVLVVPGDAAEVGVGARVIDATLARFGRIDTLINCAGIFIGKPFTDYTDEDFERSPASTCADSSSSLDVPFLQCSCTMAATS